MFVWIYLGGGGRETHETFIGGQAIKVWNLCYRVSVKEVITNLMYENNLLSCSSSEVHTCTRAHEKRQASTSKTTFAN
jgi:hypothetical protein